MPRRSRVVQLPTSDIKLSSLTLSMYLHLRPFGHVSSFCLPIFQSNRILLSFSVFSKQEERQRRECNDHDSHRYRNLNG